MKKQKQRLILQLIASNRYKIDFIEGKIYYRLRGKWIAKVPIITKEGYIQYLLRYNNKNISVYAQNLFYLSSNGEYPEDKIIDHRNNIKTDNGISNLKCLSHKENKEKSPTKLPVAKGCKRIMGNTLKQIFTLHDKGFNQSKIAKELNLHRLSVRYHIKKYLKNDTFRYLYC